jgi:hypothetical protein
MRHRKVELCAVGALAQYFYWRWHISGEPAPTFQRREDWYNIKVLRGEDREAELSYGTQYQDCLSILQEAGVTSESVTHVMRSSGAQEAERLGVPDPQVSDFTCILSSILLLTSVLLQIERGGHWNKKSMTISYLTGLPVKFLRRMAGGSKHEGNYVLPRAHCEPPQSLRRLVFPWIEEWTARV